MKFDMSQMRLHGFSKTVVYGEDQVWSKVIDNPIFSSSCFLKSLILFEPFSLIIRSNLYYCE